MSAKKETHVVERRIVKTHLDRTSAIGPPKGLHTIQKEGDRKFREKLLLS